MKAPSISIAFKELAQTVFQRSSAGVAILVIKDATSVDDIYKEYYDPAELIADKEKYTEDNFVLINDCISFAPNKTCVVRIATDGTFADATAIILNNVASGYITIPDGVTSDNTLLKSFIETQNKNGKYYMGITYKGVSDSKFIIDFYNEKVTFNDDRGEVSGNEYLSSLAGILASVNVSRSATNFICKNLIKVDNFADPNALINAGKFILINDDINVRVLVGVNSLTTITDTNTEMMQYIENVELTQLITRDVTSIFKDNYIGKIKNSYDNQMLLISAINDYFTVLASDDILSDEFENAALINVEVQRAEIAKTKPEAASWSDDEVKRYPVGRVVYLMANIKPLYAMDSMAIDIYMN